MSEGQVDEELKNEDVDKDLLEAGEKDVDMQQDMSHKENKVVDDLKEVRLENGLVVKMSR